MDKIRFWKCRFLGLAMVALPLCAGAQDSGEAARQILDRMLQQYQAGVSGIDTYTVETNQQTLHYRKTVADGWPSFALRAETQDPALAGMNPAVAVGTAPSLFDREAFEKLRAQAVYAGRQMVDGRPMHGIRADRIDGIFPEGGPATVEQVLLVVDAETLDLSRLRARAQVAGPDGRQQAVTAVIQMEDYRDVQGMRMPYKTTVTVEGMGDSISPAEREQARQMLRQLEQVPPEQRAMIERMLPPGQLEQARRVLAGEPMTFETVVHRVVVNPEQPDDL